MPCCSYCGESNHNIRNCFSPSILNNYNDIKSIFQSSVSNDQFITVICRFYNLSILKVVSVKFAYSKASLNKKDHSLRLYNHFRNVLTYTPDTLPSYAQDLNQFDESNEITWFIDRNRMRNNIYENAPIYNENVTITNDFINFISTAYLVDDFIPFVQNEKKKYYITPIVSKYKNVKKICVLEDCPICYEQLKYEDIVTLNCNHEFCKTCIVQSLHTVKNGDPSCALCREKICSMLVPDVKTYDTIAEFCNL